MNQTVGTMIAVAAVLFFYLRLIVLQRGRINRFSGRSVAQKPNQFHWIVVRNGYLIGFGIFFMVIGAAISVLPWFSSFGASWWWLPVTVGILLLSFGLG